MSADIVITEADRFAACVALGEPWCGGTNPSARIDAVARAIAKARHEGHETRARDAETIKRLREALYAAAGPDDSP